MGSDQFYDPYIRRVGSIRTRAIQSMNVSDKRMWMPFAHTDGSRLRAFCHGDEQFCPYGSFIQVALRTVKSEFPGPCFSRVVKNHCGTLECVLVIHSMVWIDNYMFVHHDLCVIDPRWNWAANTLYKQVRIRQVGLTDHQFLIPKWLIGGKKPRASWHSSVTHIYSYVSRSAFLRPRTSLGCCLTVSAWMFHYLPQHCLGC